MKGANKSITYVQIKGEYVYWDHFASNQKMIHIGVLPKGTTISLISNFDIDGMDCSEVWYQVAAFDEEAYAAAYDLLIANTLQVSEFEDGYVKGNITADAEGIMMTSIPAYKGMSVFVDGEQTEYQHIGNALIGVPLNAGKHEIVVEYHMPYWLEGVVTSAIGIIVFAIYCLLHTMLQKKKKVEE
jgi:uncharacterized membrane protein YfhO